MIQSGSVFSKGVSDVRARHSPAPLSVRVSLLAAVRVRLCLHLDMLDLMFCTIDTDVS